jgi:hypothetical protein
MNEALLAIFIVGTALSWLFGSVLGGVVAHTKGRSGLGWAVGAFLLFTPLLALIALAAMPRLRKET